MALTTDQKTALRQLVANIGGTLTPQRLAQISAMTDAQVVALLAAGANVHHPMAEAQGRMNVLKLIDAVKVS